MGQMDVRVGEVVTEIVVTEGIGPLGVDEVKQLVALVLEHVRQEHGRAADRERDTRIHDRVFRPAVG